ncbi:MAG: hypothetical protein JOY77_07805 [Alphaproteobacteria bacterium]|nr:hypothetical protein [Alphaproteobacteria bacterium]
MHVIKTTSSMSAADVRDLAEWLAVIFTALAAVAGVMLVVAGRQAKRADDAAAEKRDAELTADLKDKDVEINRAKERTAVLEQDATAAKAALLDVETELAVQRQRAVSAELKLERITGQLRPRVALFVGPEADAAKGQLSRTPARVSVWCVESGVEAHMAALGLMALLQGAGWQVDDETNTKEPSGIHLTGAFVITRMPVEETSPASNLANVLLSRGFATGMMSIDGLADGEIRVYVGGK